MTLTWNSGLVSPPMFLSHSYILVYNLIVTPFVNSFVKFSPHTYIFISCFILLFLILLLLLLLLFGCLLLGYDLFLWSTTPTFFSSQRKCMEIIFFDLQKLKKKVLFYSYLSLIDSFLCISLTKSTPSPKYFQNIAPL